MGYFKFFSPFLLVILII